MCADEKPGAEAPRCVLIVDDSQMVRYAVSRIIAGMGYRVIEASNGVEALQMAEEHRPDLVVLDVFMPEKGGMEALAEWRADPRHASLPVIVLTGSSDPRIVQRAARLKVSGYLVKSSLPNPREIRRRIEKALDEVEAAPSPTAKAAAASARRISHPLSVLLADDNSLDRQLLAGLLARWGCTVAAARDGREALALVEEQSFDVVLLNDTMPGMDGYAAASRIRERERGDAAYLPIGVLSSQPVEAVWERCRQVGMDAYVGKPIDPDKLFDTLEDLGAVGSGEREVGGERDLFDRAELMERVDDDMELLERMLELFARDSPLLIEKMRRAAREEDPHGMQMAGHTLKGMLGNLSARRAANAAHRLEKMGNQGRMEGAEEVLKALERELERLSASLRQLL